MVRWPVTEKERVCRLAQTGKARHVGERKVGSGGGISCYHRSQQEIKKNVGSEYKELDGWEWIMQTLHSRAAELCLHVCGRK